MVRVNYASLSLFYLLLSVCVVRLNYAFCVDLSFVKEV